MMNEEIKNLTNEMKEVILKFSRYAAQLDDCIQSLERLLSDEDDKDSIRFLIQSYRRMRAEHNYNHPYDKLIEQENDIWNRLEEAAK